MWSTEQWVCAVNFLFCSVHDVDVEEEMNKNGGIRVQRGSGIG